MVLDILFRDKRYHLHSYYGRIYVRIRSPEGQIRGKTPPGLFATASTVGRKRFAPQIRILFPSVNKKSQPRRISKRNCFYDYQHGAWLRARASTCSPDGGSISSSRSRLRETGWRRALEAKDHHERPRSKATLPHPPPPPSISRSIFLSSTIGVAIIVDIAHVPIVAKRRTIRHRRRHRTNRGRFGPHTCIHV